jgi:hypothetical protein
MMRIRISDVRKHGRNQKPASSSFCNAALPSQDFEVVQGVRPESRNHDVLVGVGAGKFDRVQVTALFREMLFQSQCIMDDPDYAFVAGEFFGVGHALMIARNPRKWFGSTVQVLSPRLCSQWVVEYLQKRLSSIVVRARKVLLSDWSTQHAGRQSS